MACGHMARARARARAALAMAVAVAAMVRAMAAMAVAVAYLRYTHQASGVPVRGAHAYISLYLPHISPVSPLYLPRYLPGTRRASSSPSCVPAC